MSDAYSSFSSDDSSNSTPEPSPHAPLANVASVRDFVEKMLLDTMSKDTIQVFFLSYRHQLSTSGDSLLDILTTIYEDLKMLTSAGLRPALDEAAVTFLLWWLEFNPSDFERRRKLLQKTLTWVTNNFPDRANRVKLQCLRHIKPKTTTTKATFAPCRLPLFAFTPKEVAEHLTLIEWELFTAIEAKEFFGQAWQQPNKATAAPNLTAINNRWNQVTGWVATEIVTAASSKRQREVAEKFIRIGEKLLKLRNFNSLMAIVYGLNSGSIQRLKTLWDSLSSNSRSSFDKLHKLLSPVKNYKEYRAYLAASSASSSSTPLLPYVGLFLRDMTLTVEGNANAGKDHLNLDKMAVQANLIRDFQHFQRPRKSFRIDNKDLGLETYLRSGMTSLSEDDVYALSLEWEPLRSATPVTTTASPSSTVISPSSSPTTGLIPVSPSTSPNSSPSPGSSPSNAVASGQLLSNSSLFTTYASARNPCLMSSQLDLLAFVEQNNNSGSEEEEPPGSASPRLSPKEPKEKDRSISPAREDNARTKSNSKVYNSLPGRRRTGTGSALVQLLRRGSTNQL